MSVSVVPLSAFSNLAGPALAEDLRRLMARPDYDGLVLFSDVAGEQLALLPVGAGLRFGTIAEVNGVEIEGLRPLCALRLRGAAEERGKNDERERELARIEESLKGRERYIEDCEKRLNEMGHALSEREAMVEQREQMLMAKEREFFRRSGEAGRQAANG